MKIVFLSYLHGFGGAEKQNVMLANAMAQRNHDVTLISIYADNNCYPLDERIKYFFLPDRKKGCFRIFYRYKDINMLLKKIRPDITVNFWFQSAYLTAMMNKSITGKTIYSERGDPGDKEYRGALGIVRRIVLPRIDGYVFQSKGARDYFNNQVFLRSAIIPNPVYLNPGVYPTVIKRRKAIVTVGRLHAQKNQKLLIDAFALIANEFPDYILEIYGDGELKDVLQERIERLGLSSRAFLKGTSSNIHIKIYDASLFVLSSDYEGLPNTLLEAMALGMPCISTDCRPGGAREIIDNGVNGKIVPIGDKYALANTIKEVLLNKDLSLRMSKAAKIKSVNYNPNKIYDMWENFFSIIKQ